MRKFIRFDPMPTATPQQQRARREAIARLLSESSISRQAELVSRLRAAGFPATQSSISRDLKNMGVTKGSDGYSLPDNPTESATPSLGLVAEFVREVKPAGPNLLVVTTAIGAAQRVALTLDRLKWPEIVGTLSGDDTIFVATSSAATQRRLSHRITDSLKKTAI
jgi:transcriptional regulator of arginine metabolism